MDESNPQTEAYIERYLSGKMTAQEKQAFEDLLKEDELLREELRLQQKAHQIIYTAGREEMRKEITTIWEEVKGENAPTRIVSLMTSRKYVFAGAAIFALLIASIILWQQQKPALHERVYHELAENSNISPGVIDITIKSRMGAANSGIQSREFALAYEDYHEKRYEQSSSRFSEMLDQYSDSDTIRFLAGMSFLKQKAPLEAIPYFEFLVQQEKLVPGLDSKVRWNLGLSYLLARRFADASLLLEPFIYSENKAQAAAAASALEQLKEELE